MNILKVPVWESPDLGIESHSWQSLNNFCSILSFLPGNLSTETVLDHGRHTIKSAHSILEKKWKEHGCGGQFGIDSPFCQILSTKPGSSLTSILNCLLCTMVIVILTTEGVLWSLSEVVYLKNLAQYTISQIMCVFYQFFLANEGNRIWANMVFWNIALGTTFTLSSDRKL